MHSSGAIFLFYVHFLLFTLFYIMLIVSMFLLYCIVLLFSVCDFIWQRCYRNKTDFRGNTWVHS